MGCTDSSGSTPARLRPTHACVCARSRVHERPVRGEEGVAGAEGGILNFCANNYLGLSSHPEVVEAAVQALRTHGAGVSSVRCAAAPRSWVPPIY